MVRVQAVDVDPADLQLVQRLVFGRDSYDVGGENAVFRMERGNRAINSLFNFWRADRCDIGSCNDFELKEESDFGRLTYGFNRNIIGLNISGKKMNQSLSLQSQQALHNRFFIGLN